MAGPQAAENRQPTENLKKEKRKKPVREALLAALLAGLVLTVAITGLQMTTGGIDWLPFGGGSSSRQQSSTQNQRSIVAQLTAPLFIAAGDGNGVFYLTPRVYLTARDVRQFAEDNPAIAAQMVKNWLREGS